MEVWHWFLFFLVRNDGCVAFDCDACMWIMYLTRVCVVRFWSGMGCCVVASQSALSVLGYGRHVLGCCLFESKFTIRCGGWNEAQ
jgi:hypothetical protein